ncbi:MAG: nagA [Gammaproteobacteria bacterium]|jgi:N-acetylglucosamine-6-phosphate deacetylase|nr:nagA [Gammaproteobacteria bacterium]
MNFIITGPLVYTERAILSEAAIAVSDGLIRSIDMRAEREKIGGHEVIHFPSNYYLVPGFIDLHVHGVNGHDVMDATPHALNMMSQTLAAQGTTGFLATTMTAKVNEIENALIAVRNFMKENREIKGAAILGVHLEGPFISPKKIGAQCASDILKPDIELFQRWQDKSAHVIKLVTLAPELADGMEFIRYLRKNNIIAAVGHSDATYAETLTAIAEGTIYATHLFNAMRGIHQREPGAVMAALLSEQISTELIVDGVHLHPAIVQLILKLKTKEKMIVATDAMRATCLGDGIYDLGGQNVKVKEGVATLAEGTLAGSTLTMPAAIKNLMRFTQCSLFDALKMATENPAKMLGIFHEQGSIALGKKADLVVLDEELNVVMTICTGKIVYCKS